MEKPIVYLFQAESSLSMGTCSVVKVLGPEWAWMEQEMVWGH